MVGLGQAEDIIADRRNSRQPRGHRRVVVIGSRNPICLQRGWQWTLKVGSALKFGGHGATTIALIRFSHILGTFLTQKPLQRSILSALLNDCFGK